MTIEQIAKTIEKNNWAFSVWQTKPKYKNLVKHVHNVGDTAQYIKGLVDKNNSEEIQIAPAKKNGSSFKHGFAKTITINFKKETMENSAQLNALAGLSGLGLNMAEIFTAQEKATEVIELKQKIQILESENKTLEKENTKLENKIEIDSYKTSQKNDLLEVIKSPQVMTLATALLSRGAAPALGTPAQQPVQDLDEKIQWITNFLIELPKEEELTKDFMIYIIKAYQDDNKAKIIEEIAGVLTKYGIIKQIKEL